MGYSEICFRNALGGGRGGEPVMVLVRGGIFICSKLGQNLSEIEVRIFVRIQRLIWDHLLVFKAEIILKQALFQFPC